MISVARHPRAALRSWLKTYGTAEYSYDGIGALLDGLSQPGYRHDSNRLRIGSGQAAWNKARSALTDWTPFSMPWVLTESTGPVAVGTAVAVGVRLAGLTFGGVCRINAVIDELDRFGFSYGTTRHVARGEEMFLVRKDEHGDIWFSIDVFARPAVWYTWLGRRVFERYRRQFRKDAGAAMFETVGTRSG